jgi:heparan-alpha-glucosaminide N-acetyltransferase
MQPTTVPSPLLDRMRPTAAVTPDGAKRISARLASVDAYRGFVMFLMMAEVLHLSGVARAFPDSALWGMLAFNTTHVEWVGCSLHDLIQPSFSFLVGVALPFSIASRMATGQSQLNMTGHALWRALLLILLGVFLRSVGSSQTNWTFEDTLTQIGLGYPILFLLGFRSPRVQWAALAFILLGYWAAWAMYPLPGPEFDYAKVGVPPDWAHHASGFAAHWNKNSNLGAAFDQWFLNLFSRAKPFIANGGGYLTLSFIPTLGTMLLGLIAGGWLRGNLSAQIKMKRLIVAGAACAVLGGAIHWLGVCPLVKRIWTPSWTLFSGGLCFLFMAAFYGVIDLRGWKAWSFPLVVIGMNSIAAYCLAHLVDAFIASSLKTHLGPDVFKLFGNTFAPMMQGAAILLVLWLMLYWMYRRKLFLKI